MGITTSTGNGTGISTAIAKGISKTKRDVLHDILSFK
jgi:hypothetical protein